ncbi:hypothetical protein EON63_24960 [archaeon]|nr:MAG: hypothetical protein EON63_24960 [archaeon]
MCLCMGMCMCLSPENTIHNIRHHYSFPFSISVMHYCESGSLASVISSAKKTKTFISESQIAKWLVQLALALNFLHEKHILHRYGVWSMVYDVWCMVYGVWCIMYGVLDVSANSASWWYLGWFNLFHIIKIFRLHQRHETHERDAHRGWRSTQGTPSYHNFIPLTIRSLSYPHPLLPIPFHSSATPLNSLPSKLPQVADFGLAMNMDEKGSDSNVDEAGTPYYTAPEMIQREAYSYPTDCWSLGVCVLLCVWCSIVCECVTLTPTHFSTLHLSSPDYHPPAASLRAPFRGQQHC